MKKGQLINKIYTLKNNTNKILTITNRYDDTLIFNLDPLEIKSIYKMKLVDIFYISNLWEFIADSSISLHPEKQTDRLDKLIRKLAEQSLGIRAWKDKQASFKSILDILHQPPKYLQGKKKGKDWIPKSIKYELLNGHRKRKFTRGYTTNIYVPFKKPKPGKIRHIPVKDYLNSVNKSSKSSVK